MLIADTNAIKIITTDLTAQENWEYASRTYIWISWRVKLVRVSL